MRSILGIFSRKQRTLPNENNQIQTINKNDLLKKSLQGNIKLINKTLGESSDIVIREFCAGENSNMKIGVIYTDGLTDKTFVQDFILKTLMFEIRKMNIQPMVSSKKKNFEMLKDLVLPGGDMKEISLSLVCLLFIFKLFTLSMEKAKISAKQLFTLIVLFEIGSAESCSQANLWLYF